MSEALGGAYKTYLEGLLKSPKDGETKVLEDKQNIKIYDYCDEEDFETLWEIGGSGSSELNESVTTIIIVWDGRNAGNSEPSELIPHLTPMDWALAFSIKQLSNGASPKPAIHIVDLTGKEHANKEWSMWMRDSLLPAMPWVSLYAPLVPLDDNKQPLPFRRRYYEILGFNGEDQVTLLRFVESDAGKHELQLNIPTSPKAWESNSPDLLKDLAKQWVAFLTRSDDHHDINNVIGAKFLLRLLGDEKSSEKGLIGAFHKRMEWMGPNEEEIKKQKIEEIMEEAKGRLLTELEKCLNDSSLEIAVIDDQVEQGWKGFVEKLVSGGATVTPYTDDVIDKLIEFLNDVEWSKRDFSLNLTDQIGNDSSKMEIILLDLRMPQLAEKKQDLLGLAKEANEQPADLVWQEKFEEEELENIQNGGENAEIEAQLLLPRLLSLALPLTPIVLFSSTRQAWVREKLKPYRNILTNFEKPHPISDPESVGRSITNLADCIIKGLKMQQLRLQLAHVQNTQSKIKPNREQQANGEEPCIEIYADESGDLGEGITSALAVCVFSSSEKANELQEKLKRIKSTDNQDYGLGDSMPGQRFKYFDEGNEKTTKGGFVLRKGREATSGTAVATFADKGVNGYDTDKWCVVATRAERLKEPKWAKKSLADFPDAKLDEILRFNLEFVLFVLIPYLFGKSFGGTVHINLATRRVPIKRPPNVLPKNFDVFIEGNFIQTWTQMSGFPITRGWLSQWIGNENSVHNQIKRAKTFTLGNKAKTEESGVEKEFSDVLFYKDEIRLLHNIADWVAHASNPLTQNGEQLAKALKDKKIFPKDNWFINDGIGDSMTCDEEFEKLKGEYNRLDNNMTCNEKIEKLKKIYINLKSDINEQENESVRTRTGLDVQGLVQNQGRCELILECLKPQANFAKDANYFMDALRIEYYEDKDISANALRLILRSTCVKDGKFNKQQELILWKMKDKLEKVKGEVLHHVIDELN